PGFSNCPVVLQGNTQISHHPASPFAPITRVTSCGGRTSPPAASSRSNSDVAAPVCPQVHRSASPPSDYQRVFGSATGKGLLSHQAPSTPTGGGNEEAKLEGFQQAPGGPRSSRRRKDLVATYEEAWDVKMSRRLGGMDVSRLAEGLPNGNSSNFKRFDLVRSSDRPTVTPTSSITVMRSPSLSPVLTSTEGVKLREPKPASRTSFRNSSNDTLINREIVVSPFRLKQNRLNLSLNLASNTGSSADQTAGTPTGDPAEKPSTSPPPPPPHRSASIMTPTTTQFSPTHSPTLMRHQRQHDVITAASPTTPRARGVHNPLASGVPLTPSSPSGESSSTVKGDTPDTSGGGTVPGLLPHMSRLLADWDNMSTDSCEEPWDVRQGKVISQLTRSRFIDPSEVLSAVANGNHNGAATISNGHDEGRSTKGGAEAEGVAPPLPPSLGISPPASCASPVARSPSDSKVHDCLKPLSEQPWFHPNLTRVAAEKRLRSEPEGSFLVRNSETIKNEFSLTVKHNGFLHMRITRDAQGQFVLGEYSQPYPSIPHMISHYEQTQVPVKGADSVTLFHPH
uniref:SH2 domain-containing protein n=1 Tax=Mesocestoides corti TaxID=53468 RepID=A0A5K3FCQ2_MESCO